MSKISLIEDDGKGAMFREFLEQKHGEQKVNEKLAELEDKEEEKGDVKTNPGS